jgi:hypothetical protein
MTSVNSLLGGSVNRVAFPKARVFVYGQEVSADIIDIRINQSSGSLERAPSTCSITLANSNDKYILTNKDMRKIGVLKQKMQGTWKDALASTYDNPSGFNGIEASLIDLYVDPYVSDNGTVNVNQQGSRWSVDIDLPGEDALYPLGGKSLDPATLQSLVERLAYKSPQEIYQTLAGMTDDSGNPLVLNADDALTLSQRLEGLRLVSDRPITDSGLFDVLSTEMDVPFGVKQAVVSSKMKNTVHIVPDNRNYDALTYEDKLIYEYPMSAGDCIFNSNDPVRVALRDPFNPQIWYWSFTGFLDTFTEYSGVNKESTLTLSFTDVTKMARYATIGIGTGITEASEAPIASIEGAQTATNQGVIVDKELFSNLPVYSIVESIFFGSKSAANISDSATSVLIENLKDLSKEELDRYLLESDKMTLEDWYRSISASTESAQINSRVKLVEGSTDYEVAKNKVLDDLRVKRRGKLNSLDYPGVTSPRHIAFKRNGNYSGIYHYVYGDPDSADNSVGAIPIKDLRDWNEVVHHRVRVSDLQTMHVDAVNLVEPGKDITLDQAIWKIGTNIKDYPVGGGRVFYMAPAGLTSVIGLNALDRAFGGAGSVYSSFKDRLSYLYDLADAIDWRCYATPKGDFVFEMPFYDYNPSDFWANKSVIAKPADKNLDQISSITTSAFFGRGDAVFSNVNSADTASWNLLYDELSLYSGAFNLYNTEKPDIPYDYSSCFSIQPYEQSDYSNTNTDNGVITSYRTKVNWVEGRSDANSGYRKEVVVYDPTLFPTLGYRQSEGEEMWYFIDSNEEAAVFSALQLNKINSNARNLSITTTPKFGLMVNRPLYWGHRNYYCTTVSMSHSMTWNSEISTSVNLNNVRTWSGEIDPDTGQLVYRHFGDSRRPFNLATLFKELNEKRKGSVSDSSKDNQNYKFYFQ